MNAHLNTQSQHALRLIARLTRSSLLEEREVGELFRRLYDEGATDSQLFALGKVVSRCGRALVTAVELDMGPPKTELPYTVEVEQ